MSHAGDALTGVGLLWPRARRHGRRCLAVAVAVLFPAVGAPFVAIAQSTSEQASAVAAVPNLPPPDSHRQGTARFFDAADGQLDLSYFLENPRGFLPIPIVVTEPAVGYGAGGAGMFLSRWIDGRLRTLVGAGTGRVNLDFYGLGPGLSSLDQAVHYSLEFSGGVAQANWQLAPKSPWALGVRYVYADVDPKLRDDPLFPGLASGLRVRVSAPTAIVEFDSRDNVFTPTQGIYAESSYLASRETLGASVNFERFEQIFMGWHPFPHRVTVAARANYAWSSSETPFFLRPYVQLRGVPAVRFQGDEAASVELEARWQFQGRWSAVVFGGAGTTRTGNDAFSTTQNVASGGVGFRYELASKFGMHAGIDVAHSPGTTAVYFVVGNAWFRP